MNHELLIQSLTSITQPCLCPEIHLRLVTPSDSLWQAQEEDLQHMGLSDPFWAFCWAGGQALARFLLDNPTLCAGKNVLSIGSGCGIDAIAAKMSRAARVFAYDIDALAICATQINAALNQVELDCRQEDPTQRDHPHIDLVIAGDMCYEDSLVEKLLPWLQRHNRDGQMVLVSDPERGFLSDTHFDQLATYMAPKDVDEGSGKYRVPTAIYSLQA